ARAARAAPRLLGEGAAMGVGNQLSEDALGNHDVVGQKLVASAAGGAVFNLLLGSALHAGTNFLTDAAASGGEQVSVAIKGLTTYGARDVESLAERHFGATEPGVGEKVREQLVKLSAGAAGKDPEALDALTRDAFRLGSEGAEARRVAVFDSE